ISATGTVSLNANATSYATIYSVGIISFAAAWGRSEADASIELHSGSSITAGGDISAQTKTTNVVAVKSLNLGLQNPFGLGLVATVARGSSTATTVVDEGSSITSTGGKVDLDATTVKSIATEASGGSGSDGLALVAAVALSSTHAEVDIAGTVTAAKDVSAI